MSDQNKTAISTKEAPAAIGPYSQAVRVGDMLFASGQVGLDPATGQLVAGGITEQTTRVLENVKAVVAKAGLDPAAVLREVTVPAMNSAGTGREGRQIMVFGIDAAMLATAAMRSLSAHPSRRLMNPPSDNPAA